MSCKEEIKHRRDAYQSFVFIYYIWLAKLLWQKRNVPIFQVRLPIDYAFVQIARSRMVPSEVGCRCQLVLLVWECMMGVSKAFLVVV